MVRKRPKDSSGRVQARYTGPDSQRHTTPSTFLTLGDAWAWLAIPQSVASAEHGVRLRTRFRAPTRDARPKLADRLAPRQWIESLGPDDTNVLNDKLRQWEDYYNYHGPHGGLGGRTPDEKLLDSTRT